MKIAIYGISGSGKSFTAKSLEKKLKDSKFYEGSLLIDKITDGGLSKFKSMNDSDKTVIRKKLINYLYKENEKYKHIIVDGHFSFYKNNDFEIALTDDDVSFYDHIFYINLPPQFIKELHLKDDNKKREFSVYEIEKWINFEKKEFSAKFKNNKLTYLSSKDVDFNIKKIKEIISGL